MSYETRTLKIGVCMEGKEIFHDSMTEIEIMDECGGEFLKITQSPDDAQPGVIKLDLHEWPTLKAAIEKMMKECRCYD
jgi:hypothetical protein